MKNNKPDRNTKEGRLILLDDTRKQKQLRHSGGVPSLRSSKFGYSDGKPDRDTKAGRSILLEKARQRKTLRDSGKTSQNDLVKLWISIILFALVGLFVYFSRGAHGLARWLNH